ncbi:hypothetical protein [Microcoleus anatoxicus]|uniref:hypothetical protein n=1 Tax=Microcoleus anatoxicus TaxID=2705319 RepID=UPI0030C9729F
MSGTWLTPDIGLGKVDRRSGKCQHWGFSAGFNLWSENPIARHAQTPVFQAGDETQL